MNRPLKLLIHTQYYPPEVGAPQARLSELAQGLSCLGFEVLVLTAMPNYPIGKIFPRYKGLFCKEEIGGLRVFRSFIIPSQSASLFKRLLNYFSFACSSFFVGLFLSKPDVLITESPPLFLGISSFLLSRLKGAKWIFNVADLWPKSALELGLIKETSIFYKLSTWLESFFYKHATFVTGQSKTILADITARYPNVKTYHLSNGVDTSKFIITSPSNEGEGRVRVTYKSSRSPVPSPRSVSVMYAGLHGLAQGLDQLIEAASRLCDLPDIEFVLIGDGPEKQSLINQAQRASLSNITFMDPIPKSEIPGLLATAEILIVPLKIQLTGAVPSKLYEAMAAAKPVILIASSEAADIVTKYQVGLVVKPGDIDGIVNAITYLVSNPDECIKFGKNGRAAAEKFFSREKIVLEFSKILKNI